MVLGNLTQGDGDITAQSRFRGQKVVITGVTPVFRDIETDGEQVTRLIEQKLEIHGGEGIALSGKGFQCEHALACVFAGFPHAAQANDQSVPFDLLGLSRLRPDAVDGGFD